MTPTLSRNKATKRSVPQRNTLAAHSTITHAGTSLRRARRGQRTLSHHPPSPAPYGLDRRVIRERPYASVLTPIFATDNRLER